MKSASAEKTPLYYPVEEARQAALDVLLHNARAVADTGLMRTAAWGYPEPYTRDLMIGALGILASRNEELIATLGRILEALAQNQSLRGHIPSLADDPIDRGASDTTPLFLAALAAYREVVGCSDFLEEAAQKALTWMEYQSPDDHVMVGQLPTSDWRDEHWVLGFGLYVNAVIYWYLRMFGHHERADILWKQMNRFDIQGGLKSRHVHEGLAVRRKPYYALWSYKIMNNERFDLLGNSLAILTGIAPHTRAWSLTRWIEAECDVMRDKRQLALDMPPCLFPFVRTQDPDWLERYELFNLPGDYHNGGVWPFICGFYVSALVAAGRQGLAEKRLESLTELVRPARTAKVAFGFNEWIKAQTGAPSGQDWQTWSAAMYLYAAAAVEKQSTPFFDEARQAQVERGLVSQSAGVAPNPGRTKKKRKGTDK